MSIIFFKKSISVLVKEKTQPKNPTPPPNNKKHTTPNPSMLANKSCVLTIQAFSICSQSICIILRTFCFNNYFPKSKVKKIRDLSRLGGFLFFFLWAIREHTPAYIFFPQHKVYSCRLLNSSQRNFQFSIKDQSLSIFKLENLPFQLQ